jgi:hypothetical protein
VPKVQWDEMSTRWFETGVDRGMLYVPPMAGVVWNGLVGVSEVPTGGGTTREFYIDGEKYMNLPSFEEYSATIEAFSSPPEFASCAGRMRISAGLYVCDQHRDAFSLSYRTSIGRNWESYSVGYKLHMVYNVTATVADFTHETMTDRHPLKTRSWTIFTTPEDVPSVKPASHFVVNSLKVDPADLASVEDILYGTSTTDPRFPTVDELMTLVGS